MFKRALLLSLILAAGCATTPPAPPTEPHPHVLLQTSLGDITLELDHDNAPISVDNFLSYVREGHYDGTVFHRVIRGFVVQGGGYDAQLHDRPRHAQIKLESYNGLPNLRGSLAMAREEAPDSADAEFYINLVDNHKLDPQPDNPARRWGYAVFGRVLIGMDVVDRIAALPTHTAANGMSDVPAQTVLIRKATLLPPASQ